MTPLGISPERIRLKLPRKPRIALVGLGEAARNIHVPACGLIQGLEFIAGVDPSEAARAWLRSKQPGAEAFADVASMLTATQPDWVIVATPPATHRSLCIQALRGGANVFCEKPFVEHAPDADEILRVARELGRRVVINHEFPRMRIFEKALELARSPEFGPVRFLQFWEHLWEQPGSLEGWRSQHLTLREFGTHVVDLAVRIYGSKPLRIFAQTDNGDGPEGTDLVDVVTLTFPGGRLASIVLDRVCRGPHAYLEMRMDGAKESLRASFGGEVSASFGLDVKRKRPSAWFSLCAGGQAWIERGESREVLVRESLNPFAEATARHLSRAITAEATGAEYESAEFALDIVRLVEAAYASARSGQPVTP